eukprot:scaffold6550_cov131-Isochrysis_galbana.AAC.4
MARPDTRCRTAYSRLPGPQHLAGARTNRGIGADPYLEIFRNHKGWQKTKDGRGKNKKTGIRTMQLNGPTVSSSTSTCPSWGTSAFDGGSHVCRSGCFEDSKVSVGV